MIMTVSRAYASGVKWSEARHIRWYFDTCRICGSTINAGEEVGIVYTRRKDWIMFHTTCFYKEVKENAKTMHTM